MAEGEAEEEGVDIKAGVGVQVQVLELAKGPVAHSPRVDGVTGVAEAHIVERTVLPKDVTVVRAARSDTTRVFVDRVTHSMSSL